MDMINEAIDEKEFFDKGLDKLIEKFTDEEAKVSNLDIVFICKAIKKAYRYG